MSWGATAFTPIVTYNQPPFGFAETITPPDFPTCQSDPYIATDLLKEALNKKFAEKDKTNDSLIREAVEGFDCNEMRHRPSFLSNSKNRAFIALIAAALFTYLAHYKYSHLKSYYIQIPFFLFLFGFIYPPMSLITKLKRGS